MQAGCVREIVLACYHRKSSSSNHGARKPWCSPKMPQSHENCMHPQMPDDHITTDGLQSWSTCATELAPCHCANIRLSLLTMMLFGSDPRFGLSMIRPSTSGGAASRGCMTKIPHAGRWGLVKEFAWACLDRHADLKLSRAA
jgi:hypothetical protein